MLNTAFVWITVSDTCVIYAKHVTGIGSLQNANPDGKFNRVIGLSDNP